MSGIEFKLDYFGIFIGIVAVAITCFLLWKFNEKRLLNGAGNKVLSPLIEVQLINQLSCTPFSDVDCVINDGLDGDDHYDDDGDSSTDSIPVIASFVDCTFDSETKEDFASQQTTRPVLTPENLWDKTYIDYGCIDSSMIVDLPLRLNQCQTQNKPKLLACHDMKGGYLSDRFINGGSYSDAFQIFQWNIIDIFCYFSHNMVGVL